MKGAASLLYPAFPLAKAVPGPVGRESPKGADPRTGTVVMAERVEMVRMPKMVVETRGKMAAMADNQPFIFCTICCRYGIKITFHTLQHYFCPLTLLCSNILNLAQI